MILGHKLGIDCGPHHSVGFYMPRNSSGQDNCSEIPFPSRAQRASERPAGLIQPNPKLKLLDQVRQVTGLSTFARPKPVRTPAFLLGSGLLPQSVPS